MSINQISEAVKLTKTLSHNIALHSHPHDSGASKQRQKKQPTHFTGDITEGTWLVYGRARAAVWASSFAVLPASHIHMTHQLCIESLSKSQALRHTGTSRYCNLGTMLSRIRLSKQLSNHPPHQLPRHPVFFIWVDKRDSSIRKSCKSLFMPK